MRETLINKNRRRYPNGKVVRCRYSTPGPTFYFHTGNSPSGISIIKVQLDCGSKYTAWIDNGRVFNIEFESKLFYIDWDWNYDDCTMSRVITFITPLSYLVTQHIETFSLDHQRIETAAAILGTNANPDWLPETGMISAYWFLLNNIDALSAHLKI